MGPRQYGRSDRGAQRTRLTGAGDLHDAAGDVGVDLHEKRISLGDAASAHNLVGGHAILPEALDDRPRAERGRLDQRAIDIRPCRIKILTKQQAGEALVDENGAIAIVPVEPQKSALAWTPLRGLRAQLSMERSVATQNNLDPPFEYVADGRLAGFDAEETGQNGALHDAADAWNISDRLFGRHARAVASRRADPLDERAPAHPAADRAVVNVKFSDRDRNALAEPAFRRPFGAQRPGRLGCVVCLFVKAVSKFGEARVERAEEFLVRKTAPVVGIEGLVTGGAHPPFN